MLPALIFKTKRESQLERRGLHWLHLQQEDSNRWFKTPYTETEKSPLSLVNGYLPQQPTVMG